MRSLCEVMLNLLYLLVRVLELKGEQSWHRMGMEQLNSPTPTLCHRKNEKLLLSEKKKKKTYIPAEESRVQLLRWH